MPIIHAFVAAFFPTAIYTLLLWWLDRYEKEPLPLLVAAFLWGALPAILLAVLFEFVLAAPIDQSSLGPSMRTWVLAPLVEEPIKGLALIALFSMARHEFDGPLDGIVYGALIGFGFSMTENLLYFLHYPDFDTIFWLRSVIFGMNHAFFTSMLGLSLGAVRYSRSRQRTFLAIAGGLALAILFHALHNFVVRYQFTGMLLSWLIQSSGVIVVLAVAVLAWRHELRWMQEQLGEEVRNGVISLDDYAEVTSSLMRGQRQFTALLSGGWTHYRQVCRFHYLTTKLAFRKSQVHFDGPQSEESCRQLRQEIIALRSVLHREESVLSDAS
jgi:RsiW-degrading membrane proteinase PrsW (M82 family)